MSARVQIARSRRPRRSRRRHGTTVAALLAAALVAASCGSTDQGVTASRSDEQQLAPDPSDTPDGPGPDDTLNPLDPTDDPVETIPPLPGGGVIDFGAEKTPREYDAFLDAAFTDIQAFWEENFEAVYGTPFEPVAGIYAHYPERSDLPVDCGSEIAYEQVEMNAFYTLCGDIIVYDDAQLLPQLVETLGAAAVGVVAAHEYGHAVQNRSGFFALERPTVEGEQQADCFAGAWAAHVALGESELLTFDDNDVKAGIVAMIEVRDPPGIDVVADPNGHGTAFDRVGAFQEGFINGVQRCADFVDDPNPRIDLVFTTQQEAETGGDLPLDQILEELPLALETFWAPTLANADIAFTPPPLEGFDPAGAAPDCDGLPVEQLVTDATYCSSTNTIVFDGPFVSELWNLFGDLSFSYPIAVAYSDAVQVALGSGLAGEPRELLNDCLVGAWIIDIVPSGEFDVEGNPLANNPNQRITLSAGDLDEVVLTAVALGDEATSADVRGTAFEKIDAFRTGVQRGLPGCQELIDQP